MKLIASLTTIPRRFEFLKTAIKSVVSQTAYDKVDLFYINVDDNLTEDDYARYESLKEMDPKIRVKKCPAKWRSCNKLLWVMKDHPDDAIICFDDDKNYPRDTIRQNYEMWKKFPECIIAQEINPVVRLERDGNIRIEYRNIADVKFNQLEFGKYLSNGCLFPPHCFDDMVWDYDKMMEVTDGNHDELWFWLCSTLRGVRSIGLDYTFSHSLDSGVCLDVHESNLTNINVRSEIIKSYNDRINEKYGERLNNIVNKIPVEFHLNHSNIFGFAGSLKPINNIFKNFPILLVFDRTIVDSWRYFLGNETSKYEWAWLKFTYREKKQ
jgi:Glycosyltransferases, probably involved in cell wall biogenesis